MKKLINLILFITICVASIAQVPQGINYQGLLRDDDGAFLSETDVQLSIQLLEGSPTGRVVYNEFHDLRTSQNGVFETVVGTGNSVFGEFENIDWSAGPLFMEVTVDTGDGPINMGTTQVMSVPYALYADKAQEVESVVLEKIDGLNITGIEVDQILRWNGSEFVADNERVIGFTAGTGISITGNTISATGDIDPSDDITTSSVAGGDLEGTYPNPQISSGAIEAENLDDMGALNDQVLKWNGSQWVPQNDDGQEYSAGSGIELAGNAIRNTGDLNGSDDITLATPAGGVLVGNYPNPGLRNSAVNSDAVANRAIQNRHLENAAVSGNKIANMGAANNQVLKWNGTEWAPADDQGQAFSAGEGIDITGNEISNSGDLDGSDDITIGDPAGGDLSGSFPNPTVGAIQGNPVIGNPSPGTILKFTGSEWTPSLDLMGSSFWQQNGGNIYYEDGAVGVGTTSPQTQGLHVNNGDFMLTSETAASPFLTMGDEDANGYRYSLGMLNDGILGFWSGDDGLVTGRMYMDQDGHFGIGTNSPGANLYIYEEDPSVGFSYLQLSHNEIGNSYGDGAQIGVIEDDLRFYNMEAEGDIVFSTDASGYDMMIDPDGKVGVGTSSPEAALDVQADVLRTARIKRTREDASAILQIEDGNENIVQIQANAQGTADYAYDGEVIMSHDQSGNMGIGTVEPQSKLHLHDDASSAYLKVTNESTGQSSGDGTFVGMSEGNAQIVNNEPGGDIEFHNRSLNTMTLKSTGVVEAQVIEVQQTTETPLPHHIYGNSMPIAYGTIDYNTSGWQLYSSYGIESLTWDGSSENWEVKLLYEIEAPAVITSHCSVCEDLGYVVHSSLLVMPGETSDIVFIDAWNPDEREFFNRPRVSFVIFGNIAE